MVGVGEHQAPEERRVLQGRKEWQGRGLLSPHVPKAVMEEGTEIQVCSDFPMSKDYLGLPGTRGTRRSWEPPPALALRRAPRCGGHCQSLLVF